YVCLELRSFFFFQAEDGIRDGHVTGVQTCALPISDLNGCKRVAHTQGRNSDPVSELADRKLRRCRMFPLCMYSPPGVPGIRPSGTDRKLPYHAWVLRPGYLPGSVTASPEAGWRLLWQSRSGWQR